MDGKHTTIAIHYLAITFIRSVPIFFINISFLLQVGYGVPATLCLFIGLKPHVTGRVE